jgi:hypothetical protein
VEKICEGFVALYHSGERNLAADHLSTLDGSEAVVANHVKTGRGRLAQIRHSMPVANLSSVVDVSLAGPPEAEVAPAAAPAPAEAAVGAGPAAGTETRLAGLGASGLEREQIVRLTQEDPEFRDVYMACVVIEWGKGRPGVANEQLLAELKKRMTVRYRTDTPKEISKKAHTALAATKDYQVHDLLYRWVWCDAESSYCLRAVVPAGGLRSFHFNGRKYRLPLRKALLLMYHDGAAMGAHAGREDTLAKIGQVAWFPGMSHCSGWAHALCARCIVPSPR